MPDENLNIPFRIVDWQRREENEKIEQINKTREKISNKIKKKDKNPKEK